MARTPQDVTETELEILQLLWDHGPRTIRQLTEAIYPHGGTPQYATVQKYWIGSRARVMFVGIAPGCPCLRGGDRREQ